MRMPRPLGPSIPRHMTTSRVMSDHSPNTGHALCAPHGPSCPHSRPQTCTYVYVYVYTCIRVCVYTRIFCRHFAQFVDTVHIHVYTGGVCRHCEPQVEPARKL